jgi:indole-3-glycerol phosphate synthase
MTTILDKILATKINEIDAAKKSVALETLKQQISELPKPRDFAAAIRTGRGRVRLIAEVKKASPSAGLIRADFDPVQIARSYASAGAACISVLTDEHYFQGHLEYLSQIREIVDLPLLRKDFIVDPYQVYEARAAGADCILLIAECLTPPELITLHELSCSLGMQTLIELYDRDNLPAVLKTGGQIIGINNRDLRTFVTDLEHTIRLRAEIPPDRIVVGESGIRTPADVSRLAQAGVDAMLVGESLMRNDNIENAVNKLLFAED